MCSPPLRDQADPVQVRRQDGQANRPLEAGGAPRTDPVQAALLKIVDLRFNRGMAPTRIREGRLGLAPPLRGARMPFFGSAVVSRSSPRRSWFSGLWKPRSKLQTPMSGYAFRQDSSSGATTSTSPPFQVNRWSKMNWCWSSTMNRGTQSMSNHIK